MTSKKRILLSVAVLLIAVVAGGLYYLLRNLDSLVEDAIERYGSQATRTEVTVDSVQIDLRKGAGTIRGLKIGNPDGFDEPHAFAWDEVSIDIDLESLRSAPPYVIESVRIDAPEVVMAVNEQGRINLLEIRDALDSGASAAPADESPSGADDTRLRILSFTFERGRAAVYSADVGGQDAQLELPALKLKDLGGSQGAPPAKIARMVLTTYIQQVVNDVARQEAGRRIEGLMNEQLGDENTKAVKGLFDQLRGR